VLVSSGGLAWAPFAPASTIPICGYDRDLTRSVKPKNPPKLRAMPVLVRQYLKRSARLPGFHIDPDFGDVLDRLVLVDLTKVDRPVLVRYLGKESAATFLGHHGLALRGEG
jgi:hypothetical protein